MGDDSLWSSHFSRKSQVTLSPWAYSTPIELEEQGKLYEHVVHTACYPINNTILNQF